MPNLPIAWCFFSGWDRELFESTAAAYERDQRFIEVLAKNNRLELDRIRRRLKAAVEVREKFSAALVLVAGGASFWSLGPICNNIVKGDLAPWFSLQTVGLLAMVIAFRTLFIALRIGELLVCLEEAENLRKKLHSHAQLDERYYRAILTVGLAWTDINRDIQSVSSRLSASFIRLF